MRTKEPTRLPNPREIIALDILDGAHQHLKGQFDTGMTRVEAAAHFEARVRIWNAQNAILKDLGLGITRQEIQYSTAKHRGGCRG
jgi:hypothetical protein